MSCIRKRVQNERELAGSLNNAGSNVKETKEIDSVKIRHTSEARR